jgi:DNA polymerase-1
MSDKKRLFLIDAMPLLYRGHFIFLRNPRITAAGLNVSALFGFANSLAQIVASESPTHVAVVFDSPQPTFRHELYPEYKAQREAAPEDLVRAIPMAEELAQAMSVSLLRCPGYEADDVIGTLSRRAAEEGFETFMVTPDKDFAQLVREDVFLYRPGKGSEAPEILGPREVCERWGLERVEQVAEDRGAAPGPVRRHGEPAQPHRGGQGQAPREARSVCRPGAAFQAVGHHLLRCAGQRVFRCPGGASPR